MAEANQERNKELWDYTNFEAQRKHLEQAGLSVGLMYGNGGAMNASTSGGQGSGVQKPGNPTETAIQSKALGIQMQQMQSQTALNAASAAKQMAEAEKIKNSCNKHGSTKKKVWDYNTNITTKWQKPTKKGTRNFGTTQTSKLKENT